MRKIIKNQKGEVAVINHLLPFFKGNLTGGLDTNEDLILPDSYRVYNFIDDVEDALDEKVVGKFQLLFEKYGLSCRKYNKGKVFSIDSFSIEKGIDFDEDVNPRHGQDGGVVGFCLE